jgi:hypothetical protein
LLNPFFQKYNKPEKELKEPKYNKSEKELKELIWQLACSFYFIVKKNEINI